MRFKRPNGAIIIAFVALFAALGGSAYAASQITSKNIKNGTIKEADLSSSAKRAMKGKTGARGTQGPQGIAGPQGPAGPAATVSVVTVSGPHQFIPPGGTSTGLRAECPAGMVVVGTGINTGIGNADFVLSYGRFVGGFVDNDVSITIEAYVQAICASGVADGGGTSAAGAASSERAFKSAEAKARAN